MLTCCRCNIEKDETEFYKDSTKARGYSYRCKQCNKKNEKQYRDNNQQAIKEYRKTYVYSKKKESDARYYRDNCTRIKQHVAEYVRLKRKIDPYFRAVESLRCRIGAAFRAAKTKKSNHTSTLLGCDYITFRSHIERLFKQGMTWENHGYGRGYWVFDHIIPLSSFNLAESEQALKANNYMNIQPLWYEENASKGCKILI